MNVQGTVKEKAEAEDGCVISLDIPSFKSQYPTKLNRVPPEEAAEMVVGQTYVFDLEKGNPKRGKAADSPNAWDLWWNYKGFSLLTNAPRTDSATPAPQTTIDERGQSIERQVALKVAGELYVSAIASMGSDDPARQEALALARRLAAYFFQEDEQSHPLA